MRLIVKEYIAQLKEKDELDLLLCELYNQKGYIPDNRPKTGNRQYGVDIQMHNATELLLFVVKQGNIDRSTWSGNQNAVRESLEEIRDAYLNMLTVAEMKKRIKIIVATNGLKEESIRPNWNGYVNNNSSWNGKKIEIGFLGIDEIVQLIQEELLNEYLFDRSAQSALRKALYFVGEGDYKRQYYEKVIDSMISNIKAAHNGKSLAKAMACLHMASVMMSQYASDNGVNKIAIMISEYSIIRYWQYLLSEGRLGKAKYVDLLIKLCHDYEKWNDLYCDRVKEVCRVKEKFPNYNVVENRVMIYEILGYLVSYANYLNELSDDRQREVLNSIIALVNGHPEYVYAPYDADIGTMIGLYRLLAKQGREKEIKILMEEQGEKLKYYFKQNHKYPAPSDSFEEAVKIEFHTSEEPYETSSFWGYFLLCVSCMDFSELYESMKEFLDEDLKEVTKCVWFLRANEERTFYDYYAMNLAGEGVEIETGKNYKTFKKKTKFILDQYKSEKFSFDEFSFEALEIMTCHYYGYIPRVNYKLFNPEDA